MVIKFTPAKFNMKFNVLSILWRYIKYHKFAAIGFKSLPGPICKLFLKISRKGNFCHFFVPETMSLFNVRRKFCIAEQTFFCRWKRAIQTLLRTWSRAMQALLRTWSGEMDSGTKNCKKLAFLPIKNIYILKAPFF